MKRHILSAAALLLAMILILSACGNLKNAMKLIQNAGETEVLPVKTEPETETQTEPETEPPTTAKIDRTGEEIYADHWDLTPVDYDSPALLPISEDAGQGYIDDIVFICDSPTYWLKLYGLLSDGYNTKQIWTGPEGTMTLAYLRGFRILDPIDGVERTIEETVAKHQPKMILITLGINGVAFMDQEYFSREYENLIEEIHAASPDTVIVLQSILPITPAYRGWGSITNVMITAANHWILRIAEKYGLRYLDTFSCLLGGDGNAIPELMQSDGLHPNKEGLTRVLEYIRTHAYIPEDNQ